MDETRKAEQQTFSEKLAELIAKIPDEKKEVVAAHLIGTVQGVIIAADLNQRATA